MKLRFSQVYFVSLLLTISWFASCKSTESTSSFKVDGATQSQVISADSMSLQLKSEELLGRHLSVDEICDIDFVIFNEPDSTGQQSVKAKGTVKRQKKVEKQAQQTRKAEKKTEAVAKKKEVAAAKVKAHVVQTKVCEPHRTAKIVLNVVVVLVALFMLYKFRKWLQ